METQMKSVRRNIIAHEHIMGEKNLTFRRQYNRVMANVLLAGGLRRSRRLAEKQLRKLENRNLSRTERKKKRNLRITFARFGLRNGH